MGESSGRRLAHGIARVAASAQLAYPILGIALCAWGAVSRWGSAGWLVPGALIFLDNFVSGILERRG